MNTNTLTLSDVQPEDSGNYRCVAINTCGNVSSDYANIIISGKQSMIFIIALCISIVLILHIHIQFVLACQP